MEKIKLVPLDARRGIIIAPDFCKYAVLPEDSNLTYGVVSTDICQLCRICSFEPIFEAPDDNNDWKSEEKDKANVIKMLTNDSEFLESAMKQVQYLQKQERLPLVILIGLLVLDRAIQAVASGDIAGRLRTYYTNLKEPLCHIAGMPVYFNDKLTKSAVQVVGEVSWE